MQEVPEFFDRLAFTESSLGIGRFEGDRLIVPVTNLSLMLGHPVAGEGDGAPRRGEAVFLGVVDSRRKVIVYRGDPRNAEEFEPEREEVDIVPSPAPGTPATREYGFEGIQRESNAWVDWVVRAHGFLLRLAPVAPVRFRMKIDGIFRVRDGKAILSGVADPPVSRISNIRCRVLVDGQAVAEVVVRGEVFPRYLSQRPPGSRDVWIDEDTGITPVVIAKSEVWLVTE